MEILNKIREDLMREHTTGVVKVNACPKTIVDIVKSLHDLYGGFIDWTNVVKNNEFTFAVDNLKLNFVHNIYMEENHYKLVSDKFYNVLKNIDDSKFSKIEIYSLIDERTVDKTKRCIDFCIAKNIDFNIVRKPIHIHDTTIVEIYTSNPYKYFFESLGVNKQSIQLSADAANELIKNKIERMFNYYTYKPLWERN